MEITPNNLARQWLSILLIAESLADAKSRSINSNLEAGAIFDESIPAEMKITSHQWRKTFLLELLVQIRNNPIQQTD